MKLNKKLKDFYQYELEIIETKNLFFDFNIKSELNTAKSYHFIFRYAFNFIALLAIGIVFFLFLNSNFKSRLSSNITVTLTANQFEKKISGLNIFLNSLSKNFRRKL